MLAAINRFLQYAQWISIICFVIVFAFTVLSKSTIGFVLIICFAILLSFILIQEKTFSTIKRVSPLGNPIVDILLIVYSTQEFANADGLFLMYLSGCIAVGIDLLIWFIRVCDRHN